MIRRIEAARRAGTIRADIPAATLAIMLEALLFYWIENRGTLGGADGVPPADDAYLEQAFASSSAAPRRPLRPRAAGQAPAGPPSTALTQG